MAEKKISIDSNQAQVVKAVFSTLLEDYKKVKLIPDKTMEIWSGIIKTVSEQLGETVKK